MNIQAMRVHLATELMKFEITYSHFGNAYIGFGLTKDWQPDKSAEQRDMVMDALTKHQLAFQWLITTHSNMEYKCCIRAGHSSQWDIMIEHENLGMACMIAACRANGYVDQ